MTTRLLHISDLHFGPPLVDRVAAAVPALADELRPDAIVASGDLTQNCKEAEFQDARRFLDQLSSVPILTIPGNHDVPKFYNVWQRLAGPYDLYQEYIHSELDVTLRLPGMMIVGLNSTKPLRAIKNGRISRLQLDYAKRSLAIAEPDDWRIVVAHHHFAPAPDYAGSDVMPKARRALDEFNRNAVDMILGGHLHRGYIGNSLDVYAGSQQFERGIIIVQCGTTTSRRGRAREREKNSFNVLDFDDDLVQITHWMYFDDVEGFCQVSQHRFPKPSRRSLDCHPSEERMEVEQ